MRTISLADLLRLIEEPGDRFVSLYMPTYLAGRDMPQNAVRLRKLLAVADHQLRERGMSAADANEFLASAARLLEQPLFEDSLSQSLAVLISRQGAYVWHSPMGCAEQCSVGKRFQITPLVVWLNEDLPYYVLAISQNRARLFCGGRHHLDEMQAARLPADLQTALHYDSREGSFQFHSGQPQLPGKEGEVFTGQGGEVDVAKQEIAAYFRVVDSAVCEQLHSRNEPLVFAGVDYLYPIYRQHNHYPHLLNCHISSNPDRMSADDLKRRAWPSIHLLLQHRRQQQVANYWNLLGKNRASSRIDQIVLAADAGEVDTLFICPNVRRQGSFDSRTKVVRLDERLQNDSEDLVNLAVCLTLKNRGNVEILEFSDLPAGGAVAATFRRPLPAGPPAEVASLQ